jgi:hypothetical protein
LTSYKNLQSATQVKQFQKADDRFQRELIRASRLAGGSDRKLSGVGAATGFETRTPAFLGYMRTRRGRMSLEFRKTGPWQFRDDTVDAGDTKAHEISPDPLRNKRPLTPAKIIRPTMRVRKGGGRGKYGGVSAASGKFLGQSSVTHPGSARDNYWGRAVGRAGVMTSRAMADEFKKVGRTVWP